MTTEILDLLLCDKCPGFYVVPGDERFSVSRDGSVFDRQNNTLVFNSKNKPKREEGSKTYYSVYDRPVHRLIAETFLSKDHLTTNDFPIVNHLDGDITNNDVSNLEWTSYKGNLIHAYKTGLRNDNVPVSVKDLRDNTVTHYYSYQECARVFKINVFEVHYYLNSKQKNKVFCKHYLLKRLGEEWPEFDYEYFNSFDYNKGVDLFVMDNVTKNGFIFDSMFQASCFLKIAPMTISNGLKTSFLQKTNVFNYKNWSIMFLKDIKDFKPDSYEDLRKEKKSKPINFSRKPKKITVKNLNTNEISDHVSLEVFCSMIGEKKNTVQKHISVNKGIWHGLFEIKYLS